MSSWALPARTATRRRSPRRSGRTASPPCSACRRCSRPSLDTEGFSSCTSLTRVYSGGEALTHRLARAFCEQLPGVALVNLYGPTETTINATAHRVDPARLGNGDDCTVPIGLPVDGVTAYVLDEEMAPVGVGETGELYLGGVQVARGYLDRPDQTARAFVRSPPRTGRAAVPHR